MSSFFLSLLIVSNSYAKDFDGRFAIGLDHILGDQPALSARYALPMPNDVMEGQIDGIFGFSTHPSEPTQLVMGSRFLYGVIIEDNMNVMATGGFAFLLLDGSPAARFQPGVELQFSLMGLDNLTFGSAAVVNFDLGSGNTKLGVTGNLLGSVHYWF